MEIINPSTLRGDEYLEGYSEAGEAKISVLDATRPPPIIEASTATAYTLVDQDHGKIKDFTSGSSVTVTVPTGLRTGFMCGISQGGAGVVTVAGAEGITISSAGGLLAAAARYNLLTLIQWNSGTVYRLFGELA